MRSRNSTFLFLLALLTALVMPRSAFAQAGGPVYIIRSGDTLSLIATRFDVSVADLIAANPTIDPNFLSEGQQITIPGLDGVTGILETEVISLGDSLRSLLRRTQVPIGQFKKLNRLISPSELYVGVSLIVPLQEGQAPLSRRFTPSVGESLFELAVRQGTNPWTLSAINKLNGTWTALPGDVLFSPVSGAEDGVNGLPSSMINANLTPLPLVQGGTEVIRVTTQNNIPVSGMLVDTPLHFFQSSGEQVALQGVHALLEPGVYPLMLETTLQDGSKQSFEQMILVTSGNYSREELFVEPETIDPAVTEPENKTVFSITTPSSPVQLWNGVFKSPAVYPDEFTSRFGTRRTYHGIGTDLTIEGFHTGLDFAGGDGLQIFAPAPGRVVFAAPLTVRGNATIIDHGWGVYSGFWHQSEILVKVGDLVEQGQVIGLVGGTGRVTGAHLHWEVWVNGVQVNPLNWLDQAYP